MRFSPRREKTEFSEKPTQYMWDWVFPHFNSDKSRPRWSFHFPLPALISMIFFFIFKIHSYQVQKQSFWKRICSWPRGKEWNKTLRLLKSIKKRSSVHQTALLQEFNDMIWEKFSRCVHVRWTCPRKTR